MKKLEDIIKQIEVVEPSPLLVPKIVAKIKLEKRKALVRQLVWSSLLSLTSLSAVVLLLINLAQTIASSGSYQYLILLFSDSSVVVNYWQELILSISESMPVLALASFLMCSLLFCWSAVKMTKGARNVFLPV